MKKLFKMFGAGALLTAVLIAGGCGNDETSQAQGRVVKGPVSGAVVTDSKGVVVSASTDENGYYPLTGTGPYSSSGGTYYPLNADGTYSTTATSAPPLSAPAGVSQLTPLSTIIAKLPVADQATVLKALGLSSLDQDLSVKTAANSAAFVLTETVGAALTSVAAGATTADQVTTFATTYAAALNTALSGKTTITTADITAAVTAANKDITVIAALPATVPVATLTAKTNSASTGAAAVKEGTVPPVPVKPTGSTGSTGNILK